MARRTKKTALTPEERLQAALVPEGELPYPVPGNWCWVSGKGIFLPMEAKKPSGDFFDYIDIDAIDNSMQCVSTPKRMETAHAPSRASRGLRNGDTIFSLVRPYLKNIAYIDETLEHCIASTGFFICRPVRPLNGRYVYWLMTSSYVVDGLNQFMKGDNSPSIRSSDIDDFPFPIPPLPEQQRIVTRIESLFAKLDEAQEKVQAALDSFEPRKAAVLHRAFSGELTEEWRKEHGIGLESWEKMSVSELCHSLKYGTAKKSQPQGEVAVIRMGNLQHGEIDWGDLVYSSDKEDIEKYLLSSGDVLFNRTNSPALVGKTSIYRGGIPAIYAGYLIKLDYDHSRITGDYLNYALNTLDAREYCNLVKTDGVNQSNINAKKIGEYCFNVPLLNEQTEIVRILDAFFEQESQAKAQAEAALETIDTMKKSILAKAFRGDLGTNDPGEESALELLKQSLYIDR